MDFDISHGIKRKCSSTSQIKSSKRKRPAVYINILNLSDCTLLHILNFLDATSLYQLGQTCFRFKQLVQDESLWVYVDARNSPNNINKAEFCWQNVNKRTKHILMASNRRSEVVICVETLIFSKLLTNLTVLALEHQCIKYCKLNDFPSTLQELSLRHSYIPNHLDFFRFSHDAMVNLKTLLLDHCQWFEACSLMSLSRFASLEILSLYMCKKLGDDDISSISLAGKFGFTKLRVIDLRFTGLGDLFIKTFYKSPTLQIMYYQCFSTTYRAERFKRKLDILNGSDIRQDAFVSDDEANNDVSRGSFKKRFNTDQLIPGYLVTLNDDALMVFNRLKSTEENRSRPKSFLYVYPYNECTCGYYYRPKACGESESEEEDVRGSNSAYNRRNSSSSSDSSGDDCDDNNDDDDWDFGSIKRKLRSEQHDRKYSHNNVRKCVFFINPKTTKVCGKLSFNSCMIPLWCQDQSTPTTCEQKWMIAREPRNDYEISMLEHTDKHFKIRLSDRCGSQNSDCECGDSYSEEEDNVIVVTRNEDGRMVINTGAYQQAYNMKKNAGGDVKIIIRKLADCLRKNAEDSTKITAVTEFLAVLDESLRTQEYGKFIKDAILMYDLQQTFKKLSNCVRQNMEHVLKYHYGCFNDLMNQLQNKHKSNHEKKCLISLFFQNLSESESGEDLLKQSNGNRVLTTQRYTPIKYLYDTPGPSGLQSMKFRKVRKNRKMRNMMISQFAMTNSDSDSGDEPEKEYYSIPVYRNENIIRLERPPDIVEEEEDYEDGENGNYNFRSPPWVALQDVAVLVQLLPPHIARNVPTNMKELSLRGFPVTDYVLNVLKELELDLLDVTQTEVTVDGVKRFMLSNPQCRVIHESACVCRPKLHF